MAGMGVPDVEECSVVITGVSEEFPSNLEIYHRGRSSRISFEVNNRVSDVRSCGRLSINQ